MMTQSSCWVAVLVLMLGAPLSAQNQDSTSDEHKPTSVGKGIDYLFNYLNMAGTMQASEFRPLTQRERTHLYLKTMVNPLGYIKAGFSAGLDDNRYFNSGKKGFWPRTGYALASGVLSRHDNGSLHLSISQVGGVAGGAFLSRFWLPPSQHSAGDAAVSFGITMASNMGFGLVKEFLPDLGRALAKKRKKGNGVSVAP